MQVGMDVYLRKFLEEDILKLTKLANNRKIADNLRDAFPHPYTLEHAQAFVRDAQEDVHSMRRAIIWKGEYVGNIGLHYSDDVYRFNAEIGYFVGESYWGRGIATQAIPLMLAEGFKNPRIYRVFAGVFSYNPASVKVLEKVGFRDEGVALGAISKNGKIYDEFRYAMLRSEFEKLYA